MGNHKKKKKKKNKRGKMNKSTAEPSPDSECASATSFQGEDNVPGDGEPSLTEFQSKLGSEGQEANNKKFNDEFEIGETNDFPLRQIKARENNKAEDEASLFDKSPFAKRPRFSDKDSGTSTKSSVHELDKESLADTATKMEFPEEANSSQPSKKRKKKKRKKQADSQEPGQAFAKPTSQPETPVGASPQKESHREKHRSDSVTTAIPTNTEGQLLTTNEDG